MVNDIFFAHYRSVDLLLHAFSLVLLMDCTYKTNIYNLPLLEMVGVTSTGITFLIRFAYMEFERKEKLYVHMWYPKGFDAHCSEQNNPDLTEGPMEGVAVVGGATWWPE